MQKQTMGYGKILYLLSELYRAAAMKRVFRLETAWLLPCTIITISIELDYAKEKVQYACSRWRVGTVRPMRINQQEATQWLTSHAGRRGTTQAGARGGV